MQALQHPPMDAPTPQSVPTETDLGALLRFTRRLAQTYDASLGSAGIASYEAYLDGGREALAHALAPWAPTYDVPLSPYARWLIRKRMSLALATYRRCNFPG